MDLNLSSFRDEIFDSELCEDAVITIAASSTTKSIRVDFRNDYDEKNTTGIAFEGEDLLADIRTADATGVKTNDTLKVGTTTYKITNVQPSEDGITRLILTKTS